MSSISSDDEEFMRQLQLALAISLGKEPGPASQNSSPSAESPQPPTTNNTGDALAPSSLPSNTNSKQPPSATPSSTSIATLDRKQMEMERLARQDARKRALEQVDPHSDDDKARDPKKARDSGRPAGQASSSRSRPLESSSNTPRELPSGKRRSLARAHSKPMADSTPSHSYAAPRQHHTSTAYRVENASEMPYLKPTVKKTWCFRQPRENDVKIEEILQKDKLKMVAMSAFQCDFEWWLGKIDTVKTKQAWAIGVSQEDIREDLRQMEAMIPNLTVCCVDLSGVKCINHGKFLILAFPTHLRVVISSANLTDYDWGERGNMENSVFLIDLPRLQDGQSTSDADMTFFGKELLHYLDYLGMRPDLTQSLRKFDWSGTKDIAFVHSMAGVHVGEEAQRTGIFGLSKAVEELELQTDLLEMDYATSSLGCLNRPFLSNILAAGRGEEPRPSLTIKNEGDEDVVDVPNRFRVYYPTKNTIESSRGGPNAAGTICLLKRWYEASSFPKEVMRDHKSTRGGILSHNKIILARGTREGEDEDSVQEVAWAYIGSANLTQSAWGTLTRERTTKRPKLTIRNYECGVLIPVTREKADKDGATGQVPSLGVFDGTLEIPFTTPGARYDGKVPWTQTDF